MFFSRKPDYRELAERKLRGKFSVGEEFDYLGRKLRITGFSVGDPVLGRAPALACDYVDNNGIIRNWNFTVPEAMSLVEATK